MKGEPVDWRGGQENTAMWFVPEKTVVLLLLLVVVVTPPLRGEREEMKGNGLGRGGVMPMVDEDNMPPRLADEWAWAWEGLGIIIVILPSR